MHEQPVALVTGGNRGIGREICRQLHARGFHVLLAARDPRAASPSPASSASPSHPSTSATPPASTAWSPASRAAKLGLDVLVHNAGVTFPGFDARVARDTLAVNFFAVHDLTVALLPFLRPHARVVIVSSGVGDRSKLAPALRARFADGALDRPQLVDLMQAFVTAVADGVYGASGWPLCPPTASRRSAPPCSPRISRARLADDPRRGSASTQSAPAG